MLIFSALAITTLGYVQGKGVAGGFQGATTFVLCGSIGVLLCIAGIVCAAIGGLRTPRSPTTKFTLLVAGMCVVALGAITVRIVAALSK